MGDQGGDGVVASRPMPMPMHRAGGAQRRAVPHHAGTDQIAQAPDTEDGGGDSSNESFDYDYADGGRIISDQEEGLVEDALMHTEMHHPYTNAFRDRNNIYVRLRETLRAYGHTRRPLEGLGTLAVVPQQREPASLGGQTCFHGGLTISQARATHVESNLRPRAASSADPTSSRCTDGDATTEPIPRVPKSPFRLAASRPIRACRTPGERSAAAAATCLALRPATWFSGLVNGWSGTARSAAPCRNRQSRTSGAGPRRGPGSGLLRPFPDRD